MRLARLLFLLLVCGAALFRTPAAEAQTLAADLSSHLVAITTGFTGAEVVLFGATEGQGDVVVVVRGPERRIVVRHKSRVAGVWINTRRVIFATVPSYYAVYSSRPLAEIMPPQMQAQHQIGFDNLRLGAANGARSPEDLADFRAALFAEQQRQGLYTPEPGKIVFLGDRLFRTTIQFPANVPTGTYLVEVFLLRGKAVVSGQTTPLTVSQSGVNADVNDFAERWALLYGLVAVAGAAVAGWLSTLPFRNA